MTTTIIVLSPPSLFWYPHVDQRGVYAWWMIWDPQD